jgi:signal transduction histidine kinase
MEDIKYLFSQEAQIIIYRVFKEALGNRGKHARATHASIVIEKKDDSVFFVVEDSGNGFDAEYVRAHRLFF